MEDNNNNENMRNIHDHNNNAANHHNGSKKQKGSEIRTGRPVGRFQLQRVDLDDNRTASWTCCQKEVCT